MWCRLRLPPLRERAEDIGDLARHFFAQAVAEGLPLKSLEPAALEALKRYRWPGNIRELENLVRRLAALYPQELISEQIVVSELGLEAATRKRLYPADGRRTGDLWGRRCARRR